MSVTAFNRQRREIEQKKEIKVPELKKITDYEEMTKPEIVEKLTDLGIDFDARKNKESLIELLKAGE